MTDESPLQHRFAEMAFEAWLGLQTATSDGGIAAMFTGPHKHVREAQQRFNEATEKLTDEGWRYFHGLHAEHLARGWIE